MPYQRLSRLVRADHCKLVCSKLRSEKSPRYICMCLYFRQYGLYARQTDRQKSRAKLSMFNYSISHCFVRLYILVVFFRQSVSRRRLICSTASQSGRLDRLPQLEAGSRKIYESQNEVRDNRLGSRAAHYAAA